MITNRPLPPPSPTPLCATYARHLPLLRANELTPDQAEALRDHLADCAWCQSMLVTCDVVDDVLRRHFGPGHMAPSAVTTEEIMRATDQEDRISPSDGDSDSDDELVTTDLHTLPPRRWLHQPRRLLSGLAAVAAVLLVVLLAELLFALHGAVALVPAARPTPSPTVPIAPMREFALPTATSAPQGITAGPDGALWFTDVVGNQIGRITTSGQLLEFAVPTPGSTPDYITLGPDGALWFTESQGNKIGRFSLCGRTCQHRGEQPKT